jgi:hypothetical protein
MYLVLLLSLSPVVVVVMVVVGTRGEMSKKKRIKRGGMYLV